MSNFVLELLTISFITSKTPLNLNEIKNNMFKIKNFSIVPKFFILLIDLGATLLALFFAILIQYNVSTKILNWGNVINAMILITLINALVFIVTKSYTGIVRYTGVQDALRIFLAVASSSFLILVLKCNRIINPIL